MTGRCLVLGGSGFLGRCVVDEMAANGFEVAVVGRSATTNAESGVAHEYTLELPSPELANIVAAFRPTLCIHLIGRSRPHDDAANPTAERAAQVEPLSNLLEAVRQRRPRCHVIYVSSAAVYGRPVGLPVDESQRPAPCSPNGFHKLMCEMLAEEYRLVHGLRISIARVFNAYGPAQRRQLVWDLCSRAARSRDQALEVFGSGDQERDLIHARDVAAALFKVAMRPKSDPAERNQAKSSARPARPAPPDPHIFNIGTGRAVTTATVARHIAAAWSPDMKVRFNGRQDPRDVPRIRADIGRLKALGFSPQVSLEEGLAEFVRWFQADMQTKIPA